LSVSAFSTAPVRYGLDENRTLRLLFAAGWKKGAGTVFDEQGGSLWNPGTGRALRAVVGGHAHHVLNRVNARMSIAAFQVVIGRVGRVIADGLPLHVVERMPKRFSLSSLFRLPRSPPQRIGTKRVPAAFFLADVIVRFPPFSYPLPGAGASSRIADMRSET
jgi:hypothetical protein